MSDRIVTCVDNTNKIIVSPLQSIANLVATLILIGLGLFLVRRIWKLTQPSNLVIDTFNNATGNDDLSKALTGLNQWTRETLAQELEEVRKQVNKYKDQDLKSYYALDSFPVPENATSDHLSNLINSLTSVTTGETKTAIQLMNLVFMPSGTKVSTALQSKGDTPMVLGISFEVTDLQGKHPPLLRTFWEKIGVPDEDTNKTDSDANPQPIAETTPSTPISQQEAIAGQNELTDKQKEALACYKLGRIYEERKALDLAKSQYENTLTKYPDYEIAQNALKRVLHERKTVEERYFDLLDPAAHWLAIEIAHRTLKADKLRNENEAMLYNFIGSFHRTSAQSYPDFSEFYDLAIDYFRRAIELDGNLYQPYENLAVTYIMIAQDLLTQTKQNNVVGSTLPWPSSDQIKKHLYNALTNLVKAEQLFQGHKQKQSASFSSEKVLEVERRIQVAKSSAQLLIGDPVSEADAIKGIKMKLEEGWVLESEMSSHLLYNLACWYGIADHQLISVTGALKELDKTAKEAALRYVTYSMVRNEEFANWAPADPSLSSISDPDSWEKLTYTLLQKMYEVRMNQSKDLSELEPEEFSTAVQDILTRAAKPQ